MIRLLLMTVIVAAVAFVAYQYLLKPLNIAPTINPPQLSSQAVPFSSPVAGVVSIIKKFSAPTPTQAVIPTPTNTAPPTPTPTPIKLSPQKVIQPTSGPTPTPALTSTPTPTATPIPVKNSSASKATSEY